MGQETLANGKKQDFNVMDKRKLPSAPADMLIWR